VKVGAILAAVAFVAAIVSYVVAGKK